jgi:nucleoside-diphosphate-sugar epimerase
MSVSVINPARGFAMRVFVTGASGFIGSAVVRELVSCGHEVVGLARSDASAKTLSEAGATPHRGSLEDPESLRVAAEASDGVIHLAFNHDFSQFETNCEMDRRAIGILACALEGSTRPLIVTAGIGVFKQDGVATEQDAAVPSSVFPRSASEEAALDAVARGIHATVVRLPQVHDQYRQGLITYLIDIALEKGVSAYIGEGANRWPAVHVLDAAHLYKLVLENGVARTRYHAVAEEGIPLRSIAETIGRRFDLPARSISTEQSAEHFGWLAHLAGTSLGASSALTREWLRWNPSHTDLITDVEHARPAREPVKI